MKVDNVFDIYQNCSLSALLIHEFVVSYEKVNKNKLPPSLDKILPVLPILFTKDLVISAKGRSNNIKGFYNVLEENKVLFELIPAKVESMLNKTMFSLLICHQANLLELDLKNNMIKSNLNTPRGKYTAPTIEIGEIIRTARKLGGWFSNLSDIEFLMYLNLNFKHGF